MTSNEIRSRDIPNGNFTKKPRTGEKAVLLLSLLAVILDPFFLYIPVVKIASTCLDSDNNLRIILVVFRSCVDVSHTILWWHYKSPFVRGGRLVAILAILPLPQVVIFTVSWQLFTVNFLKFIVLIQFVLRLCRIFPAYKDATGVLDTDSLHMNMVLGAAFNLVLYILASNTYLQSIWPSHKRKQKKKEQKKKEQKRNSLKRWGIFDLLPKDLRKEVEECQESTWQETTEVNLKSLLNNIPLELKDKLKPHLCQDMFLKIPDFNNLTKEQRNNLCFYAKPTVYPERSYILREGDPIYEVLFVLHGSLLSYRKHSTQIGVQVEQLSDGCFIGEELLQQLRRSQQLQPSLELPIASKTIQAITQVEAFALSAMDLNKCICSLTWTFIKIRCE